MRPDGARAHCDPALPSRPFLCRRLFYPVETVTAKVAERTTPLMTTSPIIKNIDDYASKQLNRLEEVRITLLASCLRRVGRCGVLAPSALPASTSASGIGGFIGFLS